jgi:hypothetical protein
MVRTVTTVFSRADRDGSTIKLNVISGNTRTYLLNKVRSCKFALRLVGLPSSLETYGVSGLTVRKVALTHSDERVA